MREELKNRKHCKVRVVRDVTSLFPECKPVAGAIYEAIYIPRVYQYGWSHAEFCLIDIRDKKIILRGGEFEVVGGFDV